MNDRNLRNSLVRLAFENPNLRSEILPLLTGGKTAAGVGFSTAGEALRGMCDFRGIPSHLVAKIVEAGESNRSVAFRNLLPTGFESFVTDLSLRISSAPDVKILHWEYRTAKGSHRIRVGEVYLKNGEWILDITADES